MLREKSSDSKVWTTAEIGDLFAHHRHQLSRAARRIVGDSSKAEEIVQEALLKVLVASPELPTEESAIAYLRLSVKNLCFDHLRRAGKAPKLVLLSDLETVSDFAELTVPDSSTDFERAEDAALIREALALLSPAQRAALVMWEVEGRSSEEIAKELGISHSSVRQLLLRARKTLRELLTTRIVDTERGLTAMDILRGFGQRGVEFSRKVSKTGLVLIVVLGFLLILPNTFTGEMEMDNRTSIQSDKSPSDLDTRLLDPSTGKSSPKVLASPSRSMENPKSEKSNNLIEGINLNGFRFPALDEDGVPVGFTVAFDDAVPQSLSISNTVVERTEEGLKFESTASSRSGPSAILFDQTFTLDGFGLDYKVNVVAGVGSEWRPIELSVIETFTERLSSGNYMVSSAFKVRSGPSNYVSLPLQDWYAGLDQIPATIAVKAVLDPSKTQILAQSVWVSGTSQGSKA